MVDPIFIWQKHLDKWWEGKGKSLGFDAIHVASQIKAFAFVDGGSKLPFSVAHDVTRRGSRVDFEVAAFSQKSLEAERRVFERASLLFPTTHWAKASLINDYKIPDSKAIVVPPSVEVNDAAYPNAKARGLVDVIFIGNDFVRKGGQVLLDLHQEKFKERVRLYERHQLRLRPK